MARGTTLGELVNKLRIAARYDPNPALSQNMVPLMQQTIRDTQERLYDEFDWPFLKVHPDKIVSAGQRYYDVPDNLNLERILHVDMRYGDQWQPVDRGIDLSHYDYRDSDANQREDPVQRWDVLDTGEGEQIEVWPVPQTGGARIRFSAIRKLAPLVEDSDCADLDDQLIILFAAGELLGGAKNPEAQIKFSQGAKRKELLQGRVMKTRTNSFNLGGSLASDTSMDRRGPLVAYVRNSGAASDPGTAEPAAPDFAAELNAGVTF